MKPGDALAAALDPCVLAECAGLVPDEWQRDVLRSTAARRLLNCGRQVGKSTTTAVLAIHEAVFTPGALVLVVSPSERQSKEALTKMAAVYHASGAPELAPVKSESALTLELRNRSRIVALPGQERTVRGFSGVSLLVVDEASRVEDGLYYSLRPMLAVGAGRLIALSTPAGKRGWWHEAWANGGADWQRVEIPTSACPRISREFLEEERRSLPALVFAQEYECAFNDAEGGAFSTEDVMAAVAPDLNSWTFGGPASTPNGAPRAATTPAWSHL